MNIRHCATAGGGNSFPPRQSHVKPSRHMAWPERNLLYVLSVTALRAEASIITKTPNQLLTQSEQITQYPLR